MKITSKEFSALRLLTIRKLGDKISQEYLLSSQFPAISKPSQVLVTINLPYVILLHVSVNLYYILYSIFSSLLYVYCLDVSVRL